MSQGLNQYPKVTNVHSVSKFIIVCADHNSTIDLFSKNYHGLKSQFWQLSLCWSSGKVAYLSVV